MAVRPGQVRDAIIAYLTTNKKTGAKVADIHAAVNEAIGAEVPASSVRSYLNINTPGIFERVAVGHYRLSGKTGA